MGISLSTTSERSSCLQLNDLPCAIVRHMLSFLGGGNALCFALASLCCLEVTEAAFSGGLPPASGDYLRSTPGLFIYAVNNLKLSFKEAWMNKAAEWGLIHEMKVLRAHDPPFPWGKKTWYVHTHMFIYTYMCINTSNSKHLHPHLSIPLRPYPKSAISYCRGTAVWP